MPVAESNGPELVAVSRTAADGATEAVYGVRNLAVDGHLRAHSDGAWWKRGRLPAKNDRGVGSQEDRVKEVGVSGQVRARWGGRVGQDMDGVGGLK